MRPVRPALATLAALGGLFVPELFVPGVAHADGPGYGGSADRLSLRWQEEKSESNNRTLVLYGVGFRSGSGVTVRVGSGADETVQADETGVLRVPLSATAVSDKLSPGTSVFAAGQTPAGTRWTLVGNIPPQPSGNGPADYVPWLVAAMAVLALGGGLLHPVRRRRAALATASGAGAAGVASDSGGVGSGGVGSGGVGSGGVGSGAAGGRSGRRGRPKPAAATGMAAGAKSAQPGRANGRAGATKRRA